MLQAKFHTRILLLLLMLFPFIKSHSQAFRITNDSTAAVIESNINKYPTQLQITLLYQLAGYYFDSSTEKTIKYTGIAIEEIKQTNNSKYDYLLLNTYLIAGRAYSKNNAYYFAGDAFLKAYDLSKRLDNEMLQLRSLILLANSLTKQSNYISSLKYLHEAQALAQKLNRVETKNYLLTETANVFLQLNKTDSAKLILNQLFVDLTDTSDLIKNHIAYCKLKIREEDYDEAKNHLAKALQLSGNTNDSINLHDIYFSYANIYALEKNYSEAERYLDKAFKLKAFNNNYRSLISSATIYEENKNYKEANTYYKAFYSLSDSLLREKEIVSNQNFINQVKLLDKEQEISTLKIQNYQNQKDIKKTRLLIIISSTLFTLLIIASYYIVNSQREKHRNLQVIIKQKEELTLKKHKEDLRKAELRAAIAQLHGQEIERERLAKELHDGVGGTLAGIKMELESIFTSVKKDKKINYLLGTLGNTYQEVRNISRNMSLPNFSSESLSDNIINLIQFFPGKNNLEISFNAFPVEGWDEIELATQKELYRMIQEGITNVIKHARASEMEIQIVNDGSTLTLTMDDNGVGFDTKQAWKGIGLKNMLSRAKVLKGDFNIESAPHEGTSISLTIPLKS